MSVMIADTSDHHCGSTVALCPERVPLDDGGAHIPSLAQQWLFSQHRLYWEEVARRRDKEKPDKFVLLFNGDMVEGNHHGTVQIVSGHPEAQSRILEDVMNIPLALAPDAIYVIRGTETHNGASNAKEESTARSWHERGLPVQRDPDTGAFSMWHLRLEVNGRLIDATHHGRTGQREHTRASAATLHAHDILLSHVKSGERPPDLCLRAHNHKFNDSGDACSVRVITSGCWQLSTGYVHKRHADSIADIGGFLITVDDSSEIAVKKLQYMPSRGTVCRL